MGGASNARIARTTLRSIIKNKDKIQDSSHPMSSTSRWEFIIQIGPQTNKTLVIFLCSARFAKRKPMLKFVDKRMNKLKCTDV